jgi:hypothetical protein
MDRREFMGVAAAALAAGPAMASSARAEGIVLFDARYAPSRELADALARDGLTPLATNQDVVRLWYEEQTFRRAPRIAGTTLHSDFEIVRGLLKEQRSRLRLTSLARTGSLVSWRFA